MGEGFHGWRRKFGAITQVMACVFMGAWLRSDTIQDKISFCPQRYRHHEFVSQQGKIGWHQYDLDISGPEYDTNEWPLNWSTSKIEDWLISSPRLEETLVWQWQCLEFGYGAGPTHLVGLTVQARIAPYWSFTVPLTLISLWLLLINSRIQTPKKIPRHPDLNAQIAFKALKKAATNESFYLNEFRRSDSGAERGKSQYRSSGESQVGGRKSSLYPSLAHF